MMASADFLRVKFSLNANCVRAEVRLDDAGFI